MALNDILTSMDGARDALVTAINAKGGSLAQDSTLYQCANAVTNIDSNPGTDTTDATATASDILQDKTAYAKNEKITGTIPTVTASMSDNVVTVPKGYVKSAQTLTVGTALNAFTITPAANAQVISKGSYLKGEVTVAGDTNLTAANIKSGVTIFNVAGTYEGESTGGTSAEYYKCASVDTGGVITDGKTIVVVDPVWKMWSGTYTLVDESATGDARVWKDAATGAVLKKYDYDGFRWGFWENDTINYAWCTQVGVHENPWDATLYINDESGEEFDFTLTPSTTTVPGNTWSGYKAVFDSGTGTWSFESDVTAGLAYTSVIPVVGNIYSADALVIVSLLYTGTLPLTSPTGMTSESSDEWEISASGNYGTYYPWKAFDGKTTPTSLSWKGNNGSSWWIQWQNKQKQVLVQRLKIIGADATDLNPVLAFTLQGSDDGSTWSDIYAASGLSWMTNSESKEFTFANSKSYYYHRLANITATNYPAIIELETYGM